MSYCDKNLENALRLQNEKILNGGVGSGIRGHTTANQSSRDKREAELAARPTHTHYLGDDSDKGYGAGSGNGFEFKTDIAQPSRWADAEFDRTFNNPKKREGGGSEESSNLAARKAHMKAGYFYKKIGGYPDTVAYHQRMASWHNRKLGFSE